MRLSRSTHARRKLLVPALALALAVAAVLLVTWPLVREPRLPIVQAFLYVLGAWVVVVGMLSWISRRPTADDAGSGERDG